MRNRWVDAIFVIVTVLAFSPVMLAQTAGQSGSAKNKLADSAPDLTGIWVNITKPSKTFSPKAEPSFQPWAEELWKANRNSNPGERVGAAGRVDRDPTVANCFPPGMPRILAEGSPFEIIQIPGRVVFLFERGNAVNQIWTDGRKLPEDPDSTYMGQSVGKWEGDTLVAETIGLKGTTWLDPTGHPHSDALHVVERIRRVEPDKLQIDWTFEDPKAFTKPWTGTTVYRNKPDWSINEMLLCEEDRLANTGKSLEQKASKGEVVK